MAFKRKRKSTKKRAFKRRKTFSRKKRTFIPRSLIPIKTAKRFKYATSFELTPSIGSVPHYIFSCNGLYDCDVTSTGHQPMGFDQYVGQLYDHYTVIGAKIKISFNSSGSTTAYGACRVGITVRDIAGFAGTIDEMIEQGSTRSSIVSPIGSNNQKTVTYRINPAKFLGMSKPMNNENLKGTVSTNPTEQCYFIVYAAGISDSSNSAPIYCAAELEYTAVLTERKFLTGS
jgi:hypothetical protein